MCYIEVKNVKKSFKGKHVLRGVSFSAGQGEMIAIVGKSGSGKSTLLHLLSGIEKIDSGEYFLDGKNIRQCSKTQLARIRNQEIGYILQSCALIPGLTAYENIMLPLYMRKMIGTEISIPLEKIAKKLMITEILNEKACYLSGGEKQRVAVARALVIRPKVILADEPTGALDEDTARELLELFCSLCREGNTILMVTHNKSAASCADRVIRLHDGICTMI